MNLLRRTLNAMPSWLPVQVPKERNLPLLALHLFLLNLLHRSALARPPLRSPQGGSLDQTRCIYGTCTLVVLLLRSCASAGLSIHLLYGGSFRLFRLMSTIFLLWLLRRRAGFCSLFGGAFGGFFGFGALFELRAGELWWFGGSCCGRICGCAIRVGSRGFGIGRVRRFCGWDVHLCAMRYACVNCAVCESW